MLFLFIPLVAYSYTSRNAQIIHTQWDDNTEDGKYFINDIIQLIVEFYFYFYHSLLTQLEEE